MDFAMALATALQVRRSVSPAFAEAIICCSPMLYLALDVPTPVAPSRRYEHLVYPHDVQMLQPSW